MQYSLLCAHSVKSEAHFLDNLYKHGTKKRAEPAYCGVQVFLVLKVLDGKAAIDPVNIVQTVQKYIHKSQKKTFYENHHLSCKTNK